MGAYFQQHYWDLQQEYESISEEIQQNHNHSIIRLGILTEHITKIVCDRYKLITPDSSQLSRLTILESHGLLAEPACGVFHQIRKLRNAASHENNADPGEVYMCYQNFDLLINWFEYCMTQNIRPVNQKRRHSNVNAAALIELIIMLCIIFFPFIFFGHMIVSYITNKIMRIIPLLALITAIIILFYGRFKSGKWPLPITLLIEKIKTAFYRK